MRGPILVGGVLLAASTAHAGNTLAIVDTQLDPPTVSTLGVQVLISGDDNFDATIGVRYRTPSSLFWSDAQPLLRVHPELVPARAVPASFAGSIFDLQPATDYQIELHAVDPDGLDLTWMITATTAAVPGDPATPRMVFVSDAGTLASALAAAQAGDVITLDDGFYNGQFAIHASGTPQQPIVIRGGADAAILDGGGCAGCNVLEVYGSDVHVERLTIRAAERAIRFQTPGAARDVVRRVLITDVTLGIGGQPDQTGFYICDNIVEGRLQWPLTYGDDGAAHASDDGIVVLGSGHTVCHNRISGFADALQNAQAGARANDFVANDVLWTYDDGIELDGMEGNARCLRNRFMNTYDTISTQPIYGGPAYIAKNVVVNVANEQLKLHALGGSTPQVPVGVLVYHNTFVRPYHAIQISTPDAVHEYALADNLFVGPDAPANGLTAMWDTPIDDATGSIDYDGWTPDGMFEFGYGPTGMTYASFAAVQAGGRYEAHGVLATGPLFAVGLPAPIDHHPLVAPADATLSPGSVPIDKGIALANIDDGFLGPAPDLGAIEFGCASPIYGPRPVGVDETNEVRGCDQIGPPGADDALPGRDGTPIGPAGGCCQSGGGDARATALLVVAVATARRRRRRSRTRS